MTDREKRELKDGVISIFNRFNILDHAATIGGLRDGILRYINSFQEEPVSNMWHKYSKYDKPFIGREIVVHRNNKLYYGKYTSGAYNVAFAQISFNHNTAYANLICDILTNGDEWAYFDDTPKLFNVQRTGKDCDITGIKSKHAEGKLKECIDSITEESLTKARKQLEEESVSGEFEKEFEEMFKQYCKEAPVRFSHDMYKIKDIARHFANWQKEQMMEGAIECYIRRNKYTKKNVLNGFDVTCDAVQKFNGGDKVKILVIKEEKL